MPTPSPVPQTPAARKAAEAEVRRLIDTYAVDHLRLVTTLRKWIKTRLPAAHEVVYEYGGFFVISYSPNEHGYQGVMGLRAEADGVRLYFTNGKGLPDPEKLLKGSANARWIPVETVATLKRPAVIQLVDEALARNAVPFAPEGRGSVVIRPTAAGKRSGKK